MTTQLKKNFQFETQQEILEILKISSSTLYRNIEGEIWPPPIPIGDRAVRFESTETKLVIEAMVAGKSKDEIKSLVRQIKKSRTSGEFQ